MAEIILSGVIVALLAFIFLAWRQWSQEREHLIHLIIARSPGEVKTLDRITPIRREPQPVSDDEVYEQVGI